MAITLNGSTGISTPAVTNSGAYTGDGVVFADGTPSNTLVTTTGGNVGIGTSSPSNLLQISSTNSSVYTGLNLENKSTTGINSGVKIAWTQGDTVKSSINANTYGSDYMAFNVGSDTERMRISATGNIYVGTDTTCDLLAFRSRSLASSGYQKLAGGLIMQWGFLTANATITFPIAFPTQCFGVTFGAYGTESGIPRYTSVSTTSFVYSSASFGNQDAFWLAIGY